MEVALLLEMPLQRVVVIMLEGLKRQGIIEVVKEDPLQIRILTARKAESEFEEMFLQSFDTKGLVLSGLLADFFEKVLAKLQEKVWDCDIEATRDYYRKKLEPKEETEQDRQVARLLVLVLVPLGLLEPPGYSHVHLPHEFSAGYQNFMSSASCFKGCFAPPQARTGRRGRLLLGVPQRLSLGLSLRLPLGVPLRLPFRLPFRVRVGEGRTENAQGARAHAAETRPLAWVDEFFRRAGEHIFAREEDGVVILPPNQVYKANPTGIAIIRHLLAGAQDRAGFRGSAMRQRAQQVDDFLADVRDLYLGQAAGGCPAGPRTLSRCPTPSSTRAAHPRRDRRHVQVQQCVPVLLRGLRHGGLSPRRGGRRCRRPGREGDVARRDRARDPGLRDRTRRSPSSPSPAGSRCCATISRR